MVGIVTMLLLAGRQEPSKLRTKLIGRHSPLIGARVKGTNAAPRNHNIKLLLSNIMSNVGRLDYHDLTTEGGSAIVRAMPTLACER